MKHTPATPLPTGEVSSADLLDLNLPKLQELVRRSDAYQRLVEALAQIADQPREGDIPQQVVRVQRIARALLRELGEE